MDVASRIRELMEERGWTEYRLKEEAHLPSSTVGNIFHRSTTPGIHTLERICKAFGISLCQFFAEGTMISLTAEQAALLKRWAALSTDQKQVLLDLMAKMN